MTSTSKTIPVLFFTVLLLSAFLVGSSAGDSYTTVTLNISAVTPTVTYSTLNVIATEEVKQLGYTVNGIHNASSVPISTDGEIIEIIPDSLPSGKLLNYTFSYLGITVTNINDSFRKMFPSFPQMTFTVYLSLESVPVVPTPEGSGGYIPTPDEPFFPDVPDVPSEPENPNTPGSDEPGSDEPYLPILPPAGSVYNLAGFIPIGAGALLLFLVFFWKRKVYRILKSHAKKHGEKPEKEHLKEIADAIIKLVRDEGRYPEWKKNSDVAKRLSADIVSVLDEMNYPKIVPRGALVAEIIKAARGKINKHRL